MVERVKATVQEFGSDQNTSLLTLSTTTNTHLQSVPNGCLFHVLESWGHTIVGVGLSPSHISKEINLRKPLEKKP